MNYPADLFRLRIVPQLLFALSIGASASVAEVHLASPFGTHMVLQREMKVPVWGTAEAGETVTVEFAGQKKRAKADKQGHWHLALEPLAASKDPRVFSVGGSHMAHPLRLEDVLVGEVWLCGGQSNMERQLGLRQGQKPIENWEQEVANANHPTIRQLYVAQHMGLMPQSQVEASWTVCSPETAANFTAVGYFFARDLQAKSEVPVGIIHSSWGGTPVESWMSAEALKAFPDFAETLGLMGETARDPEAAKRGYEERLANWFKANDPGSRKHPWQSPDLDTASWETMTLPTLWEDAGHPNYDGVVWYRKTFDLPATWKGGDVELRLSAIDDQDLTWVNGAVVGTTDDWQKPRAYRVPGSALKATGNVIAIRVLDTSGGGGIWNPKVPLEVVSLDQTFESLPLAGPWVCNFAVKLTGANRPPINITGSASAPSILYNAMIAPLVPYAIRGVAFYQGEANAERSKQYRTLFPAMIADWRSRWHEGEFPFLFVQIAPFKDMPPEIREAQLLAWQATKNTAMIVTTDCGDADDIHPARKQPVGARLALAARALAYHEKVEYSGPVYQKTSMEKGEALAVHFTHAASGLVAKGGSLIGFTVAGVDGVFHAAHAEIVDDTVLVSIPEVEQPKSVRYNWTNVPDGNLFNGEGLPASPFRTDVE